MDVDPWKHRNGNIKCETCMWYVPKEGIIAGIGRCRRHAPTMNGYPVVYNNNWCGDHKMDENWHEKVQLEPLPEVEVKEMPWPSDPLVPENTSRTIHDKELVYNRNK